VQQPSIPVSIIMPVWNAESTISAAIESILQQEWNDFELLIVDNGSTDRSVDIIQSYDDPRIILLHEPNKGVSRALNTGIKASKGDVIARMDADDISTPDRIKKQWDYLQEHPHVGLVGSMTSLIQNKPGNAGMLFYVQWQNELKTPDDHGKSRFIECTIAHPTWCFRRTVIEVCGMYDENVGPEDFDFLLRIMGMGIQVAKVPAVLLYWNDHENRLSRNAEHYRFDAMNAVRIKHLSKYLQQLHVGSKKIIMCGTGDKSRAKAVLLSQYGHEVFGFTDVKKKELPRFIPLEHIHSREEFLVINGIEKRGVREQIQHYFEELGFNNGVEFIHAG
jgi:glycosyltransferase involved in cell wall biosynthesis